MTFIHSYTSLSWAAQCMAKFKWKYVDRNKEVDTPEQQRGHEVHAALAARIIDRRPLHLGFDEFPEDTIRAFERRGAPIAERKLAMTRTGAPCDFFVGDVFFRGVIDVLAPLGDGKVAIGDWKTGKVREDDFQLLCFAILVFVNFPLISEAHCMNLWLQTGKPGKLYSFDRRQMPEYMARLFARTDWVEKMVAAQQFGTSPSPLCGWCPNTACEHNLRRGWWAAISTI